MTGSRPTRTTTNARQRTEPDDQCPSAVSKSSTVGRPIRQGEWLRAWSL